MKVLLVTQYFYPENFKSNDIAFELTKRGYEVTVLTGIPNYPQGSFYQGYGFFRKRLQLIDGVKVRRAFLFPRGKGGGIRLALNYFSWAFFASIFAFFLSLFYKYDAVIVHEPSPITQGIPAILVKKIQRIPLYFWVLDLWPESLISAGGVTNKRVIRLFTNIAKWIYNNSDKILISSKGFRESILEKGDYNDKIVYFPNWGENIFYCSESSFQIPLLPKGFLVMFAGNIGEAQDFESIMRAALQLKEENIKFILIGDGRKKQWVESFIKEHDLYQTVYCLGCFPIDAMPSFFAQANLMLLSLKNELIFNLTVPAKLQAYMAAGKPVIAMLNGEGRNIIEESGCGLSVAAGDFNALAESLMKLKDMSLDEMKKLGENGNRYFMQYFNLDKCMDNLYAILEEDKK
jgi:glycosyltransferase involved in cell wall biosynthesis